MQEPTLNEVHRFVEKHSCPFVTSKDVSEQFDAVSRRTINSRLNTLHNNDQLQKRKIGGNAVVWYVRD